MDDIALMREINRLEGKIDALRTIEVGGVWQDWTPTLSTVSGSITSYTASGSYCLIGNGGMMTVKLVITNNGTGAGAIFATLPFTISYRSMLIGRDDAITSNVVIGRIDGNMNRISIIDYEGAYPAQTGSEINLSGIFRIA